MSLTGLVVSDISWQVTDKDIINTIGKSDTLVCIHFNQNPANGKSLGSVYLKFVNSKAAQEAKAPLEKVYSGTLPTHSAVSLATKNPYLKSPDQADQPSQQQQFPPMYPPDAYAYPNMHPGYMPPQYQQQQPPQHGSSQRRSSPKRDKRDRDVKVETSKKPRRPSEYDGVPSPDARDEADDGASASIQYSESEDDRIKHRTSSKRSSSRRDGDDRKKKKRRRSRSRSPRTSRSKDEEKTSRSSRDRY